MGFTPFCRRLWCLPLLVGVHGVYPRLSAFMSLFPSCENSNKETWAFVCEQYAGLLQEWGVRCDGMALATFL